MSRAQAAAKSGGYRSPIAFKTKTRAVFLYGFGKNERDNIDDDELASLKEIAKAWMGADRGKIARAVKDGELVQLDPEKSADEKDKTKKT